MTRAAACSPVRSADSDATPSSQSPARSTFVGVAARRSRSPASSARRPGPNCAIPTGQRTTCASSIASTLAGWRRASTRRALAMSASSSHAPAGRAAPGRAQMLELDHADALLARGGNGVGEGAPDVPRIRRAHQAEVNARDARERRPRRRLAHPGRRLRAQRRDEVTGHGEDGRAGPERPRRARDRDIDGDA